MKNLSWYGMIWKNIKCSSCRKPNDRVELKIRDGRCFFCGFRMVSNLNGFLDNNGSK